MSQERDLFLRCLDLPDAAARHALLARECAGDRALRAGVERLLELHGRADAFLEEPAAEALAARLAIDDGSSDDGAGTSAAALDTDDPVPLGPAVESGDLGSLGRFRLVARLPSSAFGPVFGGLQGRGPDRVVVRVLAPRHARSPSVCGRFLRLARHLATVRHDALPAILAVEERPMALVVTVSLDGEPLAARLERGPPLPLAELARVGGAIAAGLAAVHAAGLVHRGLCPANVILPVDRPSPAFLVDVGLARAIDDEEGCGDPPLRAAAYLSPEQVLGCRLDPLDHRPDLFALGCVLVAMATGRSPFAAVTAEATLRRVADGTPAPGALDRLPPELGDLVTELIALDPARRPVSADGVATRLVAFAAAHG